ncbi:MAG: SGNH/GDSL hydrolase family protein [Planctomycetota bacterium]
MLSRRDFGLSTLTTLAAGSALGAASIRYNEVQWHDVSGWGVEGKGWDDTARFYDRLPARAEGVVPGPVWNLSRFSAGMSAFFRTDATDIHLRYSLRSDRLAMRHVSATAVSGIDLYAQHHGKWRWAAVAQPDRLNFSRRVAADLDRPDAPRDWRLYLPLFNGIERLEVGVPSGASFEPVPPRDEQPILCYGTSILHGSGASRPGMNWPSILGRRLDTPVLNLGFAGNGRMEREVAELFAEIDATVFVLDCAPNMWGDMIDDRCTTFVRVLRDARPDMPIVMVEGRRYGHDWIRASLRERNANNDAALQRAYSTLRDSGVDNLHYVAADALPSDGDTMIDGSHPNDLGMTMYADAIAPVIQRVLS